MIFRYGSKYGKKDIELHQYNTCQEKSILIMLAQNLEHVHYNILDEALTILNYSNDFINDLTDCEKRIILLKCRELSVGNTISFNFTCKKCNAVNNTVSNVDSFFVNRVESSIHKNHPNNNLKIKEQFKDLSDKSNNVEDYLEISDNDLDEMDSIEYEDIYDEVKNNTMVFKNDIIGYCGCGNNIPIKLTDRFIVENMSEDTIASLYKTYSDLVYFGNYSKKDIDTIIPFERSLFVGMLNSTKKELQ